MKHRIKNLLKRILQKVTKSRWFYFLTKKTYPLSHIYGFDRGVPIDRYYIENFLEKNKKFIKGNCLEILDNSYTAKFGNPTKSDILDINRDNKKATIHDDLRNLENIKENSYDCIILTQVLQFIDEYEKAIQECKRILKPDGTLLITLPSLSRIDVASGVGNDFWRWTPAGARYVFGKYFEKEKLEVRGFGNVLVGTSFWVGMAKHELNEKELDHWDPNFPVLVTIKAQK